ncbi:hypothetical protein [Streptomyces sp. NPDC059278]|uniref:hypothetical protein n=1 Tax=Streptomyces sp. NPDC059278 TaxID=3346801 RepID=UPI0036A7B547
MYRQIYPEGDVTLGVLARAALAVCGAREVTVESGMGSQVIRVPDHLADQVMRRVGLLPEESEETAPEPVEMGSEIPGSGAPQKAEQQLSTDETTPGRPAGRAAGLAAKTTARRASRRKEG